MSQSNKASNQNSEAAFAIPGPKQLQNFSSAALQITYYVFDILNRNSQHTIEHS